MWTIESWDAIGRVCWMLLLACLVAGYLERRLTERNKRYAERARWQRWRDHSVGMRKRSTKTDVAVCCCMDCEYVRGQFGLRPCMSWKNKKIPLKYG